MIAKNLQMQRDVTRSEDPVLSRPNWSRHPLSSSVAQTGSTKRASGSMAVGGSGHMNEYSVLDVMRA